jgi:hypothetical protein
MSIVIQNPGGSGGGGTTVTTPFFAPWTTNNSAGSNSRSQTNAISLFPFIVPYSQQVTNIVLSINSADSGGSLSDVGIYDTSGTLKCHAGATAFSAGVETFSMTGGAVTLTAGTYLLAITSSNTNMFWYGASTGTSGNGSSLYYYSTATTSSSGVLPSSITVSVSGSNSGQTTQSGTVWPTFILT